MEDKTKKVTTKKVTSLNLDTEVIKEIDLYRDGIPRSLYINKILLKWLKNQSKSKVKIIKEDKNG